MRKSEILEHSVMLLANLAIIIAAEMLGGRSPLTETWFFQGVALLFAVLPLVRIFTNFKVYDPTIARVTQASLAAFVIFAESRVLEFAGHRWFGLDDDTIQALVANFYIAGLLTVIIGVEMVLAKIGKRPKALLAVPAAAFFGLSAMTIAFAAGAVHPSLSAESALPLSYSVSIAVVLAYGFASLNRLRTRMPLLRGFLGYFGAGAAFIAASAVANFFGDVLVDARLLPSHQVGDVGMFLFFAAVSVMFLAFGKLGGFGGIYKDLQEEDAANP